MPAEQERPCWVQRGRGQPPDEPDPQPRGRRGCAVHPHRDARTDQHPGHHDDASRPPPGKPRPTLPAEPPPPVAANAPRRPAPPLLFRLFAPPTLPARSRRISRTARRISVRPIGVAIASNVRRHIAPATPNIRV